MKLKFSSKKTPLWNTLLRIILDILFTFIKKIKILILLNFKDICIIIKRVLYNIKNLQYLFVIALCGSLSAKSVGANRVKRSRYSFAFPRFQTI